MAKKKDGLIVKRIGVLAKFIKEEFAARIHDINTISPKDIS